MRLIDQAERQSLARGVLQVALALLAAASFGGWVVTLSLLVSAGATFQMVHTAFWIITVLYCLLALAAGNALGRRQGMRGVVAAAVGSVLAWAVLEFFFYIWNIGSAAMRAPLVLGIPVSTIGAIIGVSRRADRAAMRAELEQEERELDVGPSTPEPGP